MSGSQGLGFGLGYNTKRSFSSNAVNCAQRDNHASGLFLGIGMLLVSSSVVNEYFYAPYKGSNKTGELFPSLLTLERFV
jgi:hypothetical protein